MIKQEYEHGFGVAWQDLLVNRREGFYTSVSDFHEHAFYEVNLVLSGNIKVLLPNRVESGRESRLILTAPHTPHYISCAPDVLYSRHYLLFSHSFIANAIPQWRDLLSVFGENGNTITLSAEQTDVCERLIRQIELEENLLRRRLLVFYLLSYAADLDQSHHTASRIPPQYVMEAMAYIEEHYAQRIVAEQLAQRLYIGRTALMTAFKRETGVTLNRYLRACRLKHAVRLLERGGSEQEIAELCGFCDASNLVKVFKQEYGLTPKQYLLQKQSKQRLP